MNNIKIRNSRKMRPAPVPQEKPMPKMVHQSSETQSKSRYQKGRPRKFAVESNDEIVFIKSRRKNSTNESFENSQIFDIRINDKMSPRHTYEALSTI